MQNPSKDGRTEFFTTMPNFKDEFSTRANEYAKYRPIYPAELFQFLSSVAADHELAWDCGTGNGQSAIGLAKYFQQVYATDPSESQIENAFTHEKVNYKVEPAELCTLPHHSVDIITVAQAIHWFDHERFYATTKRVMKKDAIIAAWAYGLPFISHDIDNIIRNFHDNVVGDHWQDENRMIDNEYKTLPFPFEELQAPTFFMKKRSSLEELMGHVTTWSATKRFIAAGNADPVPILREQLGRHWMAADTKELSWQLILKIGKNTP